MMEFTVSSNMCRKCLKKVTTHQDAFQCGACNCWMHHTCTIFASLEITRNMRNGIPFKWTCNDCRVPVPMLVQGNTRLGSTQTHRCNAVFPHKQMGVMQHNATVGVSMAQLAVDSWLWYWCKLVFLPVKKRSVFTGKKSASFFTGKI